MLVYVRNEPGVAAPGLRDVVVHLYKEQGMAGPELRDVGAVEYAKPATGLLGLLASLAMPHPVSGAGNYQLHVAPRSYWD